MQLRRPSTWCVRRVAGSRSLYSVKSLPCSLRFCITGGQIMLTCWLSIARHNTCNRHCCACYGAGAFIRFSCQPK